MTHSGHPFLIPKGEFCFLEQLYIFAMRFSTQLPMTQTLESLYCAEIAGLTSIPHDRKVSDEHKDSARKS